MHTFATDSFAMAEAGDFMQIYSWNNKTVQTASRCSVRNLRICLCNNIFGDIPTDMFQTVCMVSNGRCNVAMVAAMVAVIWQWSLSGRSNGQTVMVAGNFLF